MELVQCNRWRGATDIAYKPTRAVNMGNSYNYCPGHPVKHTAQVRFYANGERESNSRW